MKTHTIKEYKSWYKPAYLANGLIGARLGCNPLLEKEMLEAGFYGTHEIHGVEANAPLPGPRIDLRIFDDCMSELPDSYDFCEQAYDFSNGELTTRFRFADHVGNRVSGSHLAFASRTSPTLWTEKVTLTAESDLRLTVSASLDIRELPIKQILSLKPEHDADIVMHVAGRNDLSTAGIALLMSADNDAFQPDGRGLWGYENECREHRFSGQLKKGESVSFTIMCSYVPSSMHSEPHWQAVRMIKMAVWDTYPVIREKNRESWKEIWKGRIIAKGADTLMQDVIDASYFYLYSTMHTSSAFGIAPFGLGNRNIYKGHVFWDSESFMFMLPLLSDENIAKAMLDYRFERLDAAKNNARLNGYRGIQFPWQSLSSGCEVTRVSAGQAGGAGEQHINFDVAMAFIAYSYVSGDDVFIREKAWPVVRGVAEWIESRVTKTDRGYEILHVCGIDEGKDNVDNDGYTNVLSARVLREANHMGQRLGYSENKKWTVIADSLVIPVDPCTGVLKQFENVKTESRMPVDPLMCFFPYGFTLGKESDLANYRFYVEHDMLYYLNFPMLSGFLGLFPALLGDRKLSLDFLERGNTDFFCEPFMQCSEYGRLEEFGNPNNRHTLFLSGRGGMMAALLMGFTRMNIWKDDENNWFEGPIVLPEGWTELEIGRIWIKGRPAKLIAKQGAKKTTVMYLD